MRNTAWGRAMKIEKFEVNENFYARRRQALSDLMAFRQQREGRACPGCDLRCPECGSTSCLCNCGPDCKQAPQMLSSDPEKFPIEEGIVPLVYALSDMEIGLPCWSCEGHEGLDGKIGKLPQVWFYVLHQAYPDVLAKFLWQLHFNGHIQNQWGVTVISADNSTDTTFAIVPDTNGGTLDLDKLRQDIRIIGKRMYDDISVLVRENIGEIDNLLTAKPTNGKSK